MFILDSLLIGGLRFVLDKVALAADVEADDEARLTESLLGAQTELEAGEISEAEYALRERDIMRHLNEARRRRRDEGESDVEYKVTGADVQLADDDDER